MRGRFAPSPSGRMHMGNLSTALLAWLQVRQAKGTMVLRIEDIDRGRSSRTFEKEIVDDLHWLGLDWDEGPQKGGELGPYHQSERHSWYLGACSRLQTYPCYCSRSLLRERIKNNFGGEPIYDGFCRGRPSNDRSSKSALRWQTPEQIVEFRDLVFGTVRQNVKSQVGEFVLRRRDDTWAYQLAVVVDDAAMNITHVFRGVDLLDSTPRQILLQRTLGFPQPVYAHAPLVLGEDGRKLSKRHRAYDLGQIRKAGVRPERVLAVLASSLGLIPKKTSLICASELIGELIIEALPKTSFPLDLSEIED